MRTKDMNKALLVHLEKQGYKGKILSIDHALKLQRGIEDLFRKGLFDEEFYKEELSSFDFRISKNLHGIKSLIIVAAPQPQVQITFHLDERPFRSLIPPTYSYATDSQVRDFLDPYLKSEGYHLEKANLPLKLLAVHSGLARYGRNNISFVNSMGSFYRLVAFYSDLPCSKDTWEGLGILASCENCSACIKACPTRAIPSDRFLLRAEKCITFHNERQGEFPDWFKSSWHNCLVGCLICQKVCPANKGVLKSMEKGPDFSHQETEAILKRLPRHLIPSETLIKLESLDIIEYLDILGRNLEVLIEKQRKS